MLSGETKICGALTKGGAGLCGRISSGNELWHYKGSMIGNARPSLTSYNENLERKLLLTRRSILG